MNDEELARAIIETFLEDLPAQIKQLKEAVTTGEAQSVERQAHKIKGASANLGGEALRALASAIEQAGKAGDMALIASRMAELDDRFDALMRALKNEISAQRKTTGQGT